jgi:hypothetical protein
VFVHQPCISQAGITFADAMPDLFMPCVLRAFAEGRVVVSLPRMKVFRLSVSIHPTIKKEMSAFFLLGKITAEIFFF